MGLRTRSELDADASPTEAEVPASSAKNEREPGGNVTVQKLKVNIIAVD